MNAVINDDGSGKIVSRRTAEAKRPKNEKV